MLLANVFNRPNQHAVHGTYQQYFNRSCYAALAISSPSMGWQYSLRLSRFVYGIVQAELGKLVTPKQFSYKLQITHTDVI